MLRAWEDTWSGRTPKRADWEPCLAAFAARVQKKRDELLACAEGTRELDIVATFAVYTV